jgi:hypothetical protein
MDEDVSSLRMHLLYPEKRLLRLSPAREAKQQRTTPDSVYGIGEMSSVPQH